MGWGVMMVSAVEFEGRRVLRDVPTMFFALAFPPLMLLLFGAIFGNTPNKIFRVGVISASLPAYMALVVAVTGLMSVPLTMAEYRDKGVLRRLRATPVSPGRLLGAQLLANLGMSIIGLALLLLCGWAAFGVPIEPDWELFLPSLVLTFAAVYAIGFLIASLAGNQRSATMIANLIYFPMIFLSGASIPSELFPPAIKDVVSVLPLTHAVDILKASWNQGQTTSWGLHVGVLAGVTVACVAVSVKAFRWG